jgi:hypothetical protein
MSGAGSTHGEDECIKCSEVKRPLLRHRRRWDDNFGMDPTKIGWEV